MAERDDSVTRAMTSPILLGALGGIVGGAAGVLLARSAREAVEEARAAEPVGPESAEAAPVAPGPSPLAFAIGAAAAGAVLAAFLPASAKERAALSALKDQFRTLAEDVVAGEVKERVMAAVDTVLGADRRKTVH